MTIYTLRHAVAAYTTADTDFSGTISAKEAVTHPFINRVFGVQHTTAGYDSKTETMTYAEFVQAMKFIYGADEQKFWLELSAQYSIFSTQKRAMLGAMPKELRNNKNFILQAVSVNGAVLHYASDTLKDDIEVVKAAVSQKRRAISYASERLKKDPSVRALLKE